MKKEGLERPSLELLEGAWSCSLAPRTTEKTFPLLEVSKMVAPCSHGHLAIQNFLNTVLSLPQIYEALLYKYGADHNSYILLVTYPLGVAPGLTCPHMSPE